MQVGCAKVTITPPLPVQLAGFGCERPANAVADDLHARALVWEHDGRMAALLACELLWVERRHLKQLRPMVESLCGVPGDHLMVAATHTHSGPDTMDWFHYAPVDPAWLHVLLKQLAGAVYLAANNLQPARVEFLSSQVGLARNRRAPRGDGIGMAPNPSGPVDQTLRVLRVLGAGDELLATVAHHATHPVVLGGASRVISGDWPGEMCRFVERECGGLCLFLNSACGDANPQAGCGRSYQDMLRVGRQAGAAVIEALCRDGGQTVDAVAAARREFALAHRPHPYLDVAYERRLAEDGDLVSEAQALRLGPVTLISAPGECLIETAWTVQQRSRAALPMVVGYANDYLGYLPLPHIYEEGGYEPSATMLQPEGVLTWVEQAVGVADLAGADAAP